MLFVQLIVICGRREKIMINNMPKEREFATYMEEYEYEEFRDFLDGEIERIAKTGFQFRIEGRNMGWRKLEGYKETEIRNTGDLFYAIANGIGDFSGRITVEYDKFIIEDDGVGLDNPQVLFEKSTSGWGNEVSIQNPFGEGFFSTLMVANKIKVRSIGFEAIFDVRKMFEQNTLDCITIKGSARRSGFVVELTDLEDEYSFWTVEQRVQEVAQFISGMNFYLNGKRLEHKKFTDTDGSPFAKVLDNEYVVGWIRPFKWGSEDGYGGDGYEVYAQERFVKEIYASGLKGIVLLKDGKVDLRSPDRKEIIRNEKSQKFEEVMKLEIKEMFKEVLIKGGDDDIDKYADLVDRYVPVEEYKPLIKFVYASDNEKFKEIIEKIKDKADAGEQIDFTQIAEEVEMEEQAIVEELELRNEVPQATETVTVERPEPQVVERVKTGSELRQNKVTFYVKKSELDCYVDKLSLAEYHKLPVIIVRNKLEERVLERMENFLHIKELRERVELSAQLKKVGAVDEIEERASWLFGVISKGLGFDRNIFRIGDMTVYKETKVGGEEIVKEEEPALAVARGSEIYIDRGCLKKNRLVASNSKNILNSDRAFIATNMEVIAHELAHVMYSTTDNTQEHAEAQVEITNKILQGLF